MGADGGITSLVIHDRDAFDRLAGALVDVDYFNGGRVYHEYHDEFIESQEWPPNTYFATYGTDHEDGNQGFQNLINVLDDLQYGDSDLGEYTTFKDLLATNNYCCLHDICTDRAYFFDRHLTKYAFDWLAYNPSRWKDAISTVVDLKSYSIDETWT